MKLKTESLENQSLIYEIQRDAETAINFSLLISIVVLGITVLVNISLFPLKEKEVKNIVFSKTSENTFETVPAKNYNEQVLIETIKNYIYYRQTFPHSNINSLKFFEIPQILENRKKIQQLFLEKINKVFVFKRDIKFNSINFLAKDSLKANITLVDSYIITKTSKPKNNTNKFEIILKYKFEEQKIKEKHKYINPLGLKITNYEIKRI